MRIVSTSWRLSKRFMFFPGSRWPNAPDAPLQPAGTGTSDNTRQSEDGFTKTTAAENIQQPVE